MHANVSKKEKKKKEKFNTAKTSKRRNRVI